MSDLLVQWLLRPQTYPESTASVAVVETHISWVFLTDDFAYKLKKPVKFDFLDFSTAELRRAACEDEVRLNRRLAADVYLGVVAVQRDEYGNFALDESEVADDRSDSAAPAIDWLVKMRRLPADRTLDALDRSGQLRDRDANRLAERLAAFYRGAERANLTIEAYRGTIARHVRANRSALLSAAAVASTPLHALTGLVKRIHGMQLRLLVLASDLFDARVSAGWVVDGHGDLRPEHIYLLPEPVVIDCIEFSAEFRRLDIADELSFLATECDFVGAKKVGHSIADRCLQLLGDAPPQELLAFYRTYRACVRAKVAALRAGQLAGVDRDSALDQAIRHLRLAESYAAALSSHLPPIAVVVHGLTGSGKSTLAAALADEFGAEWLSTDAVRRQMFGASAEPAAYGEGHYGPANRLAVYETLFEAAERHLTDGISVVLDGTFLSADLRRQAVDLVRRSSAPALFVHCTCPDDVARQRIAQRMSAGGAESESRLDIFDRQKADEEPSTTDRTAGSQSGATAKEMEIDTTQSASDQVALVIERLRDL
jgi:aminoglycoside phosphotransferase family enzyme/predicted kinase